MSKVEFARDKLRTQLSKLIDEYEAMVVLLAQMNITAKRWLDEERRGLATASKRQLQFEIEKLTNLIKTLRAETGATRRLGSYRKFLDVQVAVVPQGEFILTFPAYLLVFLFNKYPRVAKPLEDDELPLHSYIEIDYRGRMNASNCNFTFLRQCYLCMFWNEASAIELTINKPYSEKIRKKRLNALLRGAVSSAFYMVEAYCNGIAVEVFLTNRESLNEKELQRVREWDTKKGRPAYESIRNKLLHYPRLLMGASAPLIQENNSPELSYFLSSAKEFRDAIVHANPAPNYETLSPQKFQIFMRLNHEECGRIVDCSVAVIDQIATAIGRTKSVFWLQPRQTNGLFDESVFD